MLVLGVVVMPAGAPDPLVAPIGPSAGIVSGPSTPLDQLTGISFLDRLGDLSRGEVHSYLAAHPDAVSELLAQPPAAASVAGWWAASPASTRRALLRGAPELVGNLEGVPFSVRDTANRSSLAAAADALEKRLNGQVGRAEREELGTRLHMVEQVAEALLPKDGHSRRLFAFDPTGEGRAVIAIGDLARADYVSILVPGMFFGVDAQIAAWSDTAESLVSDQEAWLDRLHPGEHLAVAAVAWIGYRTPSLVNVASMELAREGQRELTATLQGLRAARGDDQPYLAVLAHSYGSTAALLSLAEDDVSVDALALVGSPGSPARTVSELQVTDGNVWVGAADWDPIPASGVFGSQPTSASYGAHRFSVAPGVDPITGQRLNGAVTHNDYFSEGGSSLRNLALIGIDEGALVTDADRAAGDAIKASGKRQAPVA
ncbi:alpha/beta hydrolase [Protaetiibacter intestinalis]|uniref:DUF1023 domain-containing protein n=1 Tax=Protaetiibacter intestinalis TaxID=2419774 RepID=A0A387B9V9_9MICO|nr:alpha/beta hydrolase [Protaetiibacter intestinalis]AYF98641.1 hypothetical protein D7I47_10470 [Protaetiibacter intestinalis]